MKFARLRPLRAMLRQPLSAACLATCLAASALHMSPASAQLALPRLGDGADITTSEERRLGDRIIRALYRDPDYLDDPQLHAYVMQIWQPLVAAAQARGDMSDELAERFAWQVLLGRDRSINAFALPGGYLGVHLGLIGAVSSSDELATVMAHELTHVTQRHIARMIGQDKKSTPLLIGSLILGALAASKSPDAAQALIIGGQAATLQNQLSFSRDMEREADRIGFALLQPAGFSQQGAVSMFDKLQQASRLNDNGSWPYLRSHPLTTERIADMQSRATHGAPAPQPTLEHAVLAGRARALTRPGTDRLRQWSSLPEAPTFAQLPPAEQLAQRYVAAMSHWQLRDLKAAQAAWKALLAYAESLNDAAALQQVRWLGAELALAADRPQEALALATPVPPTGSKPVSAPHLPRPAVLLMGQAQLALGQAQAVSDRLQTWVVQHPHDATAWRQLAQAWHAQNQALRALRAEAEAQVAQYDYAAAVDRFKAGQDLARRGSGPAEYMEASIIDTRLRAVESLLREQAREQ